jgi:hypothetical protein
MALIERFDGWQGRAAKRRKKKLAKGAEAVAYASPVDRAEAINAARTKPKETLHAIVAGGDRASRKVGAGFPPELAAVTDIPDSHWTYAIEPVPKGAARAVQKIIVRIKSGAVDAVYVNVRFASHKVSGPIKAACKAAGVPYSRFGTTRAGATRDTPSATKPVSVPAAPVPPKKKRKPRHVAEPIKLPSIDDSKPPEPPFRVIPAGGGFDPENPTDLHRLDSPLDHIAAGPLWKKWLPLLKTTQRLQRGAAMELAIGTAEALRKKYPAIAAQEQAATTVAREILLVFAKEGQKGSEALKPFSAFDGYNDPNAVNVPGFFPVPYYAAKISSRSIRPAPQAPSAFRHAVRELRKTWEGARDGDPFPLSTLGSNRGTTSGVPPFAAVSLWAQHGRKTVVLPDDVLEYTWDRVEDMNFDGYHPAPASDSRFFLFSQPKVLGGYTASHPPIVLAGLLVTRVFPDLFIVHMVTVYTVAEMLPGAMDYERYSAMTPGGRVVNQTLPMVLPFATLKVGQTIEALVDAHMEPGNTPVPAAINSFVRYDEEAARDIMVRLTKLATSCAVMTHALDNRLSFATGTGPDIKPRPPRNKTARKTKGGARYRTVYLDKGARQTLERKWYRLYKEGRGGKAAPPGYRPAHDATYWVLRSDYRLADFGDDVIETRRHPIKRHLYWIVFERAASGLEHKKDKPERVQPTRTLVRKFRPGMRIGKGSKINKPKKK